MSLQFQRYNLSLKIYNSTWINVPAFWLTYGSFIIDSRQFGSRQFSLFYKKHLSWFKVRLYLFLATSMIWPRLLSYSSDSPHMVMLPIYAYALHRCSFSTICPSHTEGIKSCIFYIHSPYSCLFERLLRH